MSHAKRVERHIIVDILAGSFGAAAIGAIGNRSWLLAGLSVLVAIALWLLERETIEEEDEVESEAHGPEKPDQVATLLRSLARRPMFDISPEKYVENFQTPGHQTQFIEGYIKGLKDGATELAQHILKLKENS